jgi:hypothetical protein
MTKAEFLIDKMIVKAHLTVFIALPNGGKTTLAKYFCEEMTLKGQKIFYINVDGNNDDYIFHKEHANKHNYSIIAPGIMGFTIEDTIKKLKELAGSSRRLDDQVYIIDTLKKFVDMMGKLQLKNILAIFRSLTDKGATVLLLGHANKARDKKTGKLVYEGTGDLHADIDEMILMEYIKDVDGHTQTITTDAFKTRSSGFTPVSYKIDFRSNRKVTLLDDVIIPVNQTEVSLIKYITMAIESLNDSQTEIVKFVMEHTEYSQRAIKSILIKKTDDENPLWKIIKGNHNKSRYIMI